MHDSLNVYHLPILVVAVGAVIRIVARLQPVMTSSVPTPRLRTPSDMTRNPSTNDSMTEDPVTTTGTLITVTTLHEILTDSVLLPVISTAELT